MIEPFRPRLKPILSTDATGFALKILARYHVDPLSFWTFEELTYLLNEHPEPQVLEKQIKEVVSVSPLFLNALKTTIKKETKKELSVHVVPSLMVYFKNHPEAVKQPMWLHQHQQIIHLLRQQSRALGEVPHKRVLDVGDLLPIASKSELRQSGRRQSIQTLIKLIRSIENYYVDNNNPKASGRVAPINQRDGTSREQLIVLLNKMLTKEYGIRPNRLGHSESEDETDPQKNSRSRPYRVSTNTVHSTRSSFNMSPNVKAVPIQKSGLSIHQLTSGIALEQANQPLEHIAPLVLTETWLGSEQLQPLQHSEKEIVKKQEAQAAKEKAKRQVLTEETLTELLKAIIKGQSGSSGPRKGDASLRASLLLTPAVLAYWRGKAKGEKAPKEKLANPPSMPQLVKRTFDEQMEPKRQRKASRRRGQMARKNLKLASSQGYESHYAMEALVNRPSREIAQETLITALNEQVNRVVSETVKRQLQTSVVTETRQNIVEVPVDLDWQRKQVKAPSVPDSMSNWESIPNHVIDKLGREVYQRVAEKLSLERRRRGL